MKKGDYYIKWNGEEFIYQGVSTPLQGIGIEEKPTKLFECGSAKFEETNKRIPIYDADEGSLLGCEEDKIFYTDSESPYVLYQHAENQSLWVIDVEGFNGFVDRGKCINVKRFSKQENIFSFL